MGSEQLSFVAGLAIHDKRENAAELLKLCRNDGYDFCTTALQHVSTSGASMGKYPGNHKIRGDLLCLDSKWWSTSIVGEITDKDISSMKSNMNSSTSDKSNKNSSGSENELARSAALVPKLCHPEPSIRIKTEEIFHSSLSWAAHMNIPAVILPPIPLDLTQSLNYARVLSGLSLTCSAANVQLWVRTPFRAEYLEAFELLCRRCDMPNNLGCMLCFGMDNPGAGGSSDSNHDSPGPFFSSTAVLSSIGLLHKFVGQNLKAVSFNTAIFLTNKLGYPTLSKSYQQLFTELLRRIGRTIRVLVEGDCRHHPPGAPDATGETGCLAYLQYLRHLRSRPEVADLLDGVESTMETPYLDSLQSPLQPLGDDLEFSTYETFEKDPVKYNNYQLAVELCLRDKLVQLLDNRNVVNNTSTNITPFEQLTQGDRDKFGTDFTHLVTILVLGAGRGPLIRSALAAVESINRQQLESPVNASEPTLLKAHVIAIEKNPSAVLYLRSLCASKELWDEDTVSIVNCDMRYAGSHPIIQHLRQKRIQRRQQIAATTSGKVQTGNANDTGIADIIVSELLGSFGDNELSPECLDGAQRTGILKDDCVCIPERYTSFLAPVSSLRLHSEARSQAYLPSSATDGPEGQPYGTLRALETPYVVRSHAAAQTHQEQPVFTFTHPKVLSDQTNDEYMEDASENGGNSNNLSDKRSLNKIETNAREAAAFAGIQNPSNSTLAAMVVNNEDYCLLNFTDNKTFGAGFGSGYGPFDKCVEEMAQLEASPKPENGTNGNNIMNDSDVDVIDSDHQSGTTIHGFLGTFDCTLYQSKFDKALSNISTAPKTFSKGMYSWFPLYFPLRQPIYLPPKATLRCAVWRKVDEKVWYEWCCEVVTRNEKNQEVVTAASPIHNPNGRSYYVRLS